MTESAADASDQAAKSPELSSSELAGKTRSQIRGLAKDKGLKPVGSKSAPEYPRKWRDPVTNDDRLRLDRGHVDQETGEPYDAPNAASDHVHGYDNNGNPIEVDGDKHIPTLGD